MDKLLGGGVGPRKVHHAIVLLVFESLIGLHFWRGGGVLQKNLACYLDHAQSSSQC